MKLFVFLRSVLSYLLIGLGFIFVIPCLIISLFPKQWRYDNRLYYWCLNIFYKITNFSTFLPMTIEGHENMPIEPAIVVANHESTLDVPVVGSLFNSYPHVWLFLSRFAKIPIIGFVLRRMNVVVDFSGLHSLMKSLRHAINILQGLKSHLVLFPEGGRYVGKINNFYLGFALIAKKTGRPVVPIMLYNCGKAYPPYSFLIHFYPIHVIIGKPFHYQEGETDNEFVERVRQWFLKKEAETPE